MKNKTVLWMMLGVGLFGIVVGALAIAVFQPALFTARVTEATVRDVLRDNPEIVLEALQTLQNRRAETGRQKQREAILANRTALLDDANSVVGGNPEGDVTVVEFFDYRCPYCRQAMTTVHELVKSDAKLRLVYKEFPILGPQSLVASRLAVAARKDPRYEALHAALMTAPGPLDENAALTIAAKLGLDRTALAEAMKAPDVDEILKANHAVARTLGIEGTPAFIVGDTLVPGVASLSDLKKLVSELRAKGGDAAIGKAGG